MEEVKATTRTFFTLKGVKERNQTQIYALAIIF